jgi:hypothetical protein
MLTPFTTKVPPETVKPVTISKEAVKVPPDESYIVKLLSLL